METLLPNGPLLRSGDAEPRHFLSGPSGDAHDDSGRHGTPPGGKQPFDPLRTDAAAGGRPGRCFDQGAPLSVRVAGIRYGGTVVARGGRRTPSPRQLLVPAGA